VYARRRDPDDQIVPDLVLASLNPGKLVELRALLDRLGIWLDVASPADLGLALDVAETSDTFEANAVLKARAWAEAAGMPALADDSGIEVDALGGAPGVHSARWVPGPDEARVAALLQRLDAVPDAARTARYRAVVALARPGDATVATASGAVEGRIARAPRGEGGFGYDPVFLVEDGGYVGARTMAELSAAEKDRVSHRARALAGLRGALASLGALG